MNENIKNAVIVFDNKTYLFGTAFGSDIDEVSGELCFNTAMSGYQEILTDPSYAMQAIVFSFPHIGNVGCNEEDEESGNKPTAKAAIFREYPTTPSNFRSTQTLKQFMKTRGILSICNVDTRKIIEDIRTGKITKCIISRNVNDVDSLLEKVTKVPSTKALNLAKEGSCVGHYKFCEGANAKNQNGVKKIAVIDYGTKTNILRIVKDAGFEVHVLPWNATFEDIASIKPDGVLLSNGPGDPTATLPFTKSTITKVMEKGIPLFGICLGNQLLALTLGCKVEKLEQGHRGTNHPVMNYDSQKVEITTQNHGFAVVEKDIPSYMQITHRSLFDGIIEGVALKRGVKINLGNGEFTTGYAAAVQYHPESSGGPHDSLYLFKEFLSEIK